jgi:GNAT superfamily N-acetyltransferase
MQQQKLIFELPVSFEHYGTVRAFLGKNQIGIAKLTRNGAIAKLADIQITDIDVCWFELAPFIKRRLNYKGKGYGSRLLDAAIEYCTSQRIERLEGDIVGNLDFLIPWYERHGFRINGGNKIIRALKA